MNYIDLDNDYIKEANAAYWEEENEMKLGIHPSQVKERIEKCLVSEIEEDFGKITFLDWNHENTSVGVYVNNNFFGIFDYDINEFRSTPDTRLCETLKQMD